MYTALFGLLDAILQRSIHLAFALVLLMLIYAASADRQGRIGTVCNVGLRFGRSPPACWRRSSYMFANFEYLTDGRIQYVSDLTPSAVRSRLRTGDRTAGTLPPRDRPGAAGDLRSYS